MTVKKTFEDVFKIRKNKCLLTDRNLENLCCREHNGSRLLRRRLRTAPLLKFPNVVILEQSKCFVNDAILKLNFHQSKYQNLKKK